MKQVPNKWKLGKLRRRKKLPATKAGVIEFYPTGIPLDGGIDLSGLTTNAGQIPEIGLSWEKDWDKK